VAGRPPVDEHLRLDDPLQPPYAVHRYERDVWLRVRVNHIGARDVVLGDSCEQRPLVVVELLAMLARNFVASVAMAASTSAGSVSPC